MDEAIEDGVGDGWAADDVAPLLDRNLARDDRRSALVTVFEDFEEIALLGLGEDGSRLDRNARRHAASTRAWP